MNARNGSMHVKKDITTAASIKITCFRYLRKLLRLLWVEINDGFAIKCLAIIEYSTINIKSGQIKKSVMLLRKKTDVQNESADVKHTGTCRRNLIAILLIRLCD